MIPLIIVITIYSSYVGLTTYPLNKRYARINQRRYILSSTEPSFFSCLANTDKSIATL